MQDQFSPRPLYVSDCILNDRDPEPSELEGLIEVTIREALYRLAKTDSPVSLSLPDKQQRPVDDQAIKRLPIRKPKLASVKSPSL